MQNITTYTDKDCGNYIYFTVLVLSSFKTHLKSRKGGQISAMKANKSKM